MQTDVDRPTAVANALAAAQTDTFEEEHPGPDILKLENTARNRVKREFKRDKVRNLWLQRLYDGTFFVAWHVFAAVARRIAAVAQRKLPTFTCPIRPYSGGELNGNAAMSNLVVELSCALCTICNAISDAACALSSVPPDLPTPQQPQPPQPETTGQRMHAPFTAAIGTPTARFSVPAAHNVSDAT